MPSQSKACEVGRGMEWRGINERGGDGIVKTQAKKFDQTDSTLTNFEGACPSTP